MTTNATHKHNASDTILRDITSLGDQVWLQYALSTAVDLRIADHIDDKALSCEELAKKLNLHAPTLYRLMRSLAANGYFKVAGDHIFAHSETSRTLRHDANPSFRSVPQLVSLPAMLKAWAHLGDSLRDGKSAFSHAHGKELYAYLPSDKHANEVFNASMAAFSEPQVRAVSEGYTDFGRCKKVLDVAGGLGHLLAAVLNHYPALEGAVLDLTHLQAPAQKFLAGAGVEARGGFIVGNMMEHLPEGFDCYMIKNALWNWKDEDGIRVLRNMRRALGKSHGRVLIVEELITADNLAHSTLFDLQMLVATHGGRSRTEQDYAGMAQEAGLRHERTIPCGNSHLMEFFAA